MRCDDIRYIVDEWLGQDQGEYCNRMEEWELGMQNGYVAPTKFYVLYVATNKRSFSDSAPTSAQLP